MRILAVRQPWAWALATGAKDIENRSWKTNYRGSVVIQASATKTTVNQVAKSSLNSLPPKKFVYGALIGVVDLLDVVPLNEDLESNQWALGPYCWKVGNAKCFKKPIPAKGKLNLYSPPPKLEKTLSNSIASAEVGSRSSKDEAWIEAMTHLYDEEIRNKDLFENYINLEDGQNALRLAECAVSNKGDVDAYLNRTLAKFINHDIDNALLDVNLIIEKDPINAHGFLLRSCLYHELGKKRLAKIDKEKAIELNPLFGEK